MVPDRLPRLEEVLARYTDPASLGFARAHPAAALESVGMHDTVASMVGRARAGARAF